MKNNIAAERARLKMSQQDLADELCVSRSAIGAWEAGETPVKVSILCQMADLFECSLDYLMARTEERTVKTVS